MGRDEDQNRLFERAHSWFTITYGQTAEQAGFRCAKIWYKPILKYDFKIHKYAEVVFGPSEKEVNALIKAQRMIRWSMIVTILALLLAMLTMMAFIITFRIEIMIFDICWTVPLAIAFFVLGCKGKAWEKIYKGKITTYMP